MSLDGMLRVKPQMNKRMYEMVPIADTTRNHGRFQYSCETLLREIISFPLTSIYINLVTSTPPGSWYLA